MLYLEGKQLEKVCKNYVRYCNDEFESYSLYIMSDDEILASEKYYDIKAKLSGKDNNSIGFLYSTCDDWDLVECEIYVTPADETLHIILSTPWDTYEKTRTYNTDELLSDFLEPDCVSWDSWYSICTDYYWELLDNEIITEKQLESFYDDMTRGKV